MNFEYLILLPAITKISETLLDGLINTLKYLYKLFVDIITNEVYISYNSYDIEYKYIEGMNWSVIGEDNHDLIEALKLHITDLAEKQNTRHSKLFLSEYDKYDNIDRTKNKNKLCAMPNDPVYHDGIYFKYYIDDTVSEDKDKNTVIRENITLYSKKNINEIKTYVDSIYTTFKKKYIDFTVDEKKFFFEYLYTLTKSRATVFKMFELSVNKCFDDLFFENKHIIIKLLNDFANKKLKSLSFLLSGPPGTGKTSIIKAIANMTGRSIISVKLSGIKTESQLSSLIHGDEIYCKVYHNSSSIGINIPKNKRIYIFEDVDADTDILNDRSIEQNESNSIKLVKRLLKENNNNDDDDDDDDNDNDIKNSQLTLSDILNVFDGVREIGESILVFTSNHPEKLDPAFKRNGRITYHLQMSKTSSQYTKNYIEYFYQTTLDDSIAFTNDAFTMADLESYCNTYDTLPELLNYLAENNFIQKN